MIAPTLRR
jgi:hypothetical protein